MSAIVAHQLTRHFGPDIKAVDGIDLDIPEGRVFGFLGQNGSGKTTTVRMLATLLSPTSGEATVGGYDIRRDAKAIRRTVGVALQEVGLDVLQTGRELLTLQGRLFGLSRTEVRRRVDALLDVVTLADAADRPISGYSGGMKRRLDLACALVHEPRIIFLDEPTTGLDPITRDAVWRYVRELNQRDGVTFFLTTQYLEEADRLADDIAIMDQGRIVSSGTPAELKASIAADAVSLTFPGGPAAHDQARAALAGIEGLEDIRDTGEELVVYIRNGSAAVPGLVRVLDDAGLPMAGLKLTHPTLDDVFLRATGHFLEVQDTPSPTAAGGAA